MSLTSIGDMARHFANLRHGAALKTRVGQLTDQLGSGQAADPVAHLGGRGDRLAAVDRSLVMDRTRLTMTRALADRLTATQSALEQVENQRASIARDLLGMPLAPSTQAMAVAAGAAAVAFAQAVSALNVNHGGESLFGGVATDRAPLADPDVILAALRGTLAGAGGAGDLAARVAFFFDDPAGGFATTAYLGAEIRADRYPDDRTTPVAAPLASDPALRGALHGLALAAMSDALSGDPAQQEAALRRAANGLLGATEPLAQSRATLGRDQQLVESAIARISAGVSAGQIRRNELIGVDPYETATALQAAETQLATHYAALSRLAGLNLAQRL